MADTMNAAAIGGPGIMHGPTPRHLKAKGGGVLNYKRFFLPSAADPGERAREAIDDWKAIGAEPVKRGDYAALMRGDIQVVTLCGGKNRELVQIVAAVVKAWGTSNGPRYIIDMSTVSPRAARAAHRFCQTHGITYLNVPLTGGQKGAESGEMVVIFGGDRDVYDLFNPGFFSLIGKPVYVGEEPDAGAAVKTVNQELVIEGNKAVSTALVLDTGLLRRDVLGGPGQADVFNALNSVGAGANAQWVKCASLGVVGGKWENAGFLVRHAGPDAVYLAQALTEVEAKRWTVLQGVLNMVVVFGHLLRKFGPNVCTQAVCREFADPSSDLDRFLAANGCLSEPDREQALALAMKALPDDVRDSLLLDITEGHFQEAMATKA